jgi:hypothetical protein
VVAATLVAAVLPATVGAVDTPVSRTATASAEVAGGLGFFPVTPCRASDTRSSTAGGRLLPGTTRDLQIGGTGSQFAVQGGNASGCGVPDGVGAVEVSVTAAGGQIASGASRTFLVDGQLTAAAVVGIP